MAKMKKPTPEENIEIQRRLRKKHPKMGTESWVASLKRKVRKQVRAGDTLKQNKTSATRNTIDSLRKQGITDAKIKKLMG